MAGGLRLNDEAVAALRCPAEKSDILVATLDPKTNLAEGNGIMFLELLMFEVTWEVGLASRTGTLKHPSSAHLAKAEVRRRAATGMLEASLKGEAAFLCNWLSRPVPR